MKDFFISYNKNDVLWAKGIGEWLKQAGYSCIMQETDFQASSNFVLEMDRATRTAQRTISILSPNYLDALYTHPEWAAAFARDPKGDKRLLIPVRVRDCSLTGLLAQIVYFDLVGLNVEEARHVFLDKIRKLSGRGATEPGEGRSQGMRDRKGGRLSRSFREAANIIHVENSVNTGIIANTLNIRPSRKSSVKIGPPSGTIAADRDKRNYIKYLIDRYNEFKKADRTVGDFKYPVIYSSIKRRYKCK
ncbi:MAG: toll/interleukin-1 receptor domain-containing protein [Thermodesulfobacteriota bacterium]